MSGLGRLEGAYALGTPEDNRRYYAEFAAFYDREFAQGLGYVYPRAIARAYLAAAGPEDAPVADIGCGTGLVAADLATAREGLVIDGMDISPEMLARARETGLYRALHEIDLTGDLGPIRNGYGAVLSTGTFTHGHLGPGPLRALSAIARPGALFVIGVNRAHHEAQGFGSVLDAMTAAGEIGPVAQEETAIYDREGHAHSGDTALVLTYRTA